MKKESVLMGKIKCGTMFEVPLLLLQEKEVEDEVKKMNKVQLYKSATPLKLNRITYARNKIYNNSINLRRGGLAAWHF